MRRYPGCGTNVWLSAQDTCKWANVWLSAQDTCKWARGWPCSVLRDRRVFCAFDARGNLTTIDGRSGDCPVRELDALLEDLIGSAHPEAPEETS